ncbi:MAG: ABC transporter permease, partial [Angelakisella sp.]
LPCVASKDIFLVQGREITPQDGENICVIPMRLSLKYSLAPGDVIDFKIKSNGYGQYFGDDKYHGIRESQAPNDAWEGETTAFKIVGIYDFQDMLSEKIENPTQNTIIFPTAVYQKLADTKAATPQPITESINFTFKLKSAMDIEAFIVETDNALKGSSFKVVLDDMGFSKISEQIKSAKQATLLSLILSTAAFAVTAVLIVYIHILRKSREYAIMRALGTTKAKSAQAVIFPVLLMCAPAIILAGITAAVTGANSMSKLRADMLPLGFVANAETNLPLLALLMLFVVLIVLILLSIGIYNVSRRSPLALLQNKK